MTALATIPSGGTPALHDWLNEGADNFRRALIVLTKLHATPDKVNIENCERSLMGAAMSIKDLWGRVQDEKIEREKALLARMERLLNDLRADNAAVARA